MDIAHRDAAPEPVVGDDFVEGLGGEEAAAELSEAEAAAAEEKAAAEAEGDPKPEKKEPEPEPAAAPEPTPDRNEQVLAEITGVLEELKKRNAEQEQEEEEAAPAPAAEPGLMERLRPLLEHSDPDVSGPAKILADALNETTDRLSRVESVVEQQQVEQLAQVLDQHIEAVSAACDPPLTKAEAQAVVDRMTDETKGPALARSLDFSDVVHIMHPGRLQVAAQKSAPATAPAKGAEGSRPVVKVADQRPDKPTVADRGGAAARSPAVQPERNESIRDTINRVFDEVLK